MIETAVAQVYFLSPTNFRRMNSCRLLAAIHIVIYTRRIVTADRRRRIIKRGQQVLLDISDFRGILLKAIQHHPDMLRIQFEQTGPDNLMAKVTSGNPGILSPGTDRFHNQFYNLVQHFLIVGIFLKQIFILNILLYQFSITLK